MKLRVLVAEDEFYTRKSILKLVGDYPSSIPLELTEAKNGEEAMEQVQKEGAPDIALLDIRMNNGDGFDLVRGLKEVNPDLLVTFISGYSEFGYAKEAIGLGVQNYLLKPVVTSELYDALDSMIEQSIRKITEYLRLILQGRVAPVEYRGARFARWFEQPYIPLLIYSSQRFSHTTDVIYENACQELGFEGFLVINLVVRMHPVSLILFFRKEKEECEGLRRELNRLLPALSEKIRELSENAVEKEELSFALGNVYQGLQTILEAFNEVFFKAKQTGAEESGNPGLERADASGSVEGKNWGDFESRLRDSLLEGDAAAIEKMFRREWNIQAIEPRQVARLINVLNEAAEWARDLDPTHTFREFMVEDVYDIKAPEELKAMLLGFIHKICSFYHQEGSSSQKQLVEKVKAYLNEHYQEDIVIKDLAHHVFFVHSKYLSSVFSKFEGSTISDYILEKRMQSAYHLIKHSDKSVTEIASEVGYNNLSYFIQKFKKFYGITPSKLERQ